MARLHLLSCSRLLVSSLFAALLGVNLINAENSNFMDILPPCAKDCAITAATALLCPLTDGVCLCKTRSFTSATLQCSTGTCGVDDQIAAIGVLGAMCDAVASSSSSSSTIDTTATSIPSTPLPTEGPSIATSTPTSSSPTAPASSPTPTSTPPLSPSPSSSPSTTRGAEPTPTPALAPPISTVVVLVTSTLDYDSVPTLNAAVGVTGGRRVGAAGAAVVGVLALL
ncbi:hypothetical protein FPV67DRAFT_1132321 [Lyophyllum atratum]|nr:hypothetical protein FPV67DRAFT_1132321 [Lyophyllum atratum]